MAPETNPQKLYKLLDKASLITIIGQTGSGKSQLIFSYLDYVTRQYTPEEFQIRAYDVVQVDYGDFEPVTKWTDVVWYPEAGKEETILADIKRIKDRMSGEEDTKQRVLIHINECDLFQTDFRESVIELCTLIAKHGKDINMQLIYETSRPAEPALPNIVVSSSDARVLCPVPQQEYADNFLGPVGIRPTTVGEYCVQTKEDLSYFKLHLPR